MPKYIGSVPFNFMFYYIEDKYIILIFNSLTEIVVHNN